MVRMGFPLLIKRNSSDDNKLSIWSPDLLHEFNQSQELETIDLPVLRRKLREHIDYLQKENIRFNYPKKLSYYTSKFVEQEWIKIDLELNIKTYFFEKTLPIFAILLFILTALGSAILTGMSVALTPIGTFATVFGILGVLVSLSAYLMVYLFSNTTSDYKNYGKFFDNMLFRKKNNNLHNQEIVQRRQEKIVEKCFSSTGKIIFKTTLAAALGSIVIGDSTSTGIKIYKEMVALAELGDKENKLLLPLEVMQGLGIFFGLVTFLSMLGFDASFANIAYTGIISKLESYFEFQKTSQETTIQQIPIVDELDFETTIHYRGNAKT